MVMLRTERLVEDRSLDCNPPVWSFCGVRVISGCHKKHELALQQVDSVIRLRFLAIDDRRHADNFGIWTSWSFHNWQNIVGNSEVKRKVLTARVQFLEDTLSINGLRWLGRCKHAYRQTASLYAVLRGRQKLEGRRRLRVDGAVWKPQPAGWPLLAQLDNRVWAQEIPRSDGWSQ